MTFMTPLPASSPVGLSLGTPVGNVTLPTGQHTTITPTPPTSILSDIHHINSGDVGGGNKAGNPSTCVTAISNDQPPSQVMGGTMDGGDSQPSSTVDTSSIIYQTAEIRRRQMKNKTAAAEADS